MVTKNSSDILFTGGVPRHGIRVAYCDVADSAGMLARSHLSGPAAAVALAEGLVAVSLMGADLSMPEEAVSLYIKCQGPIGSLLVEASFEGALRGYTSKKIIPGLDGEGAFPLSGLFGREGEIVVTDSVPGRILAQSKISAHDPEPMRCLSSYYGATAQRQVCAASCVVPSAEAPSVARGILVELLPDGDRALFDSVAALAESGSAKAILQNAQCAEDAFDAFGIGSLECDSPTRLFFGCKCSRHKAEKALLALSREERAAALAKNRGIDIFCHMCGKCHTFTADEISALPG